MDPPKNMLLILSELSNFYSPPPKIDQKTFGFIMISGKIEIKILGGDP